MFSKCEACKKKYLWWKVKRQKVVLPTGDIALSKKKLCDACVKLVQRVVDTRTKQ